jgi:hypothetical protein
MALQVLECPIVEPKCCIGAVDGVKELILVAALGEAWLEDSTIAEA